MLITRFEALGLLPNAEEFTVYLSYDGERRKKTLSLDAILLQLQYDLYVFGKIEGVRQGK